MPTRAIVCYNCGVSGNIELPGPKEEVPLPRLFRHLGHNPFSGHMHFQCPACGMVLLVDPREVLSGGTIRGRLDPVRSGSSGAGKYELLRRLFDFPSMRN